MDLEQSFVETVSSFLENSLGVPHNVASTLDGVIVFIGILLCAACIDGILKHWILPFIRIIVSKTKNKWDDLLVDGRVVTYISHIIPTYFIFSTIHYAFIGDSLWLHWVQKVILVVIIFLLVCLVNAALNVLDNILEGKDSLKGHPYQLFFQIIKVIVFIVGLVCSISVLVNRSPLVLLTGLGASAAVVSLVFKDTIVGFVSGVQLAANNMLKKGDWISIPNMNVDGCVSDINLHTVKVLNFDKSVVTIPPATLLNQTFQNWSRMQDEGARRICRSVQIDANSIHICTDNELADLRKLPYMADILNSVAKAGNRMPDGGVVSNLALFRAFMLEYIQHHPLFTPSEHFMVRELQPTELGLPLQIYFFVKEVEWEKFEAVQASVFDHVYASLPVFGLSVYQRK